MAAGETPQRQPHTPPTSVQADRLRRIDRARGMEATVPAEDVRERAAIEGDSREEETAECRKRRRGRRARANRGSRRTTHDLRPSSSELFAEFAPELAAELAAELELELAGEGDAGAPSALRNRARSRERAPSSSAARTASRLLVGARSECGLTTTTRSIPLGSCSASSRNASRSRRLMPLRATAFPTLRPMLSPSRECSRPLRRP